MHSNISSNVWVYNRLKKAKTNVVTCIEKKIRYRAFKDCLIYKLFQVSTDVHRIVWQYQNSVISVQFSQCLAIV